MFVSYKLEGNVVLKNFSRRTFLKTALLSASAGALNPACSKMDKGASGNKSELHLGIVTYNIAKDWDIDTIIKNCIVTKYEGVELRTTHAHKVEVDLTPEQRTEVKKKFEDSPIKLLSLGSTFEYHSDDPEVLRKNIEGTKEYIILARDVGAKGVKVRPNGLMTNKGIPEEKTLEQIGKSLKEVGEFAKGYGVDIRLEVHGNETSRVPRIKKIIDFADCDNVFVNWNCNPTDLEDGGIESNFNLVKSKINFVHLHELTDEKYPFRKFFRMLVDSGYKGYCCAEIAESTDPIRVLTYFRALFLAYQNII